MSNLQTAKNGQIERSPRAPADTMAGLLNKMAPEMAKALPKHISPDRMVRIAVTALRSNPKLAECTQVSFLGCVLSAAQLGLEVNTPLGQAYLIPRKDNRSGTMECTLIIGYQGFQDLARRTGEVANIYAEAVYPGDAFDYELGLDRKLRHIPTGDEHKDTDLTHVYAVVKLKSGDALFAVLTKGQVEKYRKRGASGAGVKTPWDNDYEAMAKKTAFRRLFTWIPKSAEMAGALSLDEAPEIGKPQIVAFDPSVTSALEAAGLEVEAHDPETGEIPPREPGEEG